MQTRRYRDHHGRYRVTLTIESAVAALSNLPQCDGSLIPSLPDLFQRALKKIGVAGDEATAMVQPMQPSSQALVFHLWVLARVARLYVIVIALIDPHWTRIWWCQWQYCGQCRCPGSPQRAVQMIPVMGGSWNIGHSCNDRHALEQFAARVSFQYYEEWTKN